jgi:hypothetical protein
MVERAELAPDRVEGRAISINVNRLRWESGPRGPGIITHFPLEDHRQGEKKKEGRFESSIINAAGDYLKQDTAVKSRRQSFTACVQYWARLSQQDGRACNSSLAVPLGCGSAEGRQPHYIWMQPVP